MSAGDTEFDRGHRMGKINQELHEHANRLNDINASMEKLVKRLGDVQQCLAQLVQERPSTRTSDRICCRV